MFGDSIALFVAKRKMNMKSIKVPGTPTDDIFVGKSSRSGLVNWHLTNDYTFPASKGPTQVLNKQTKSEIKHSSESVSSAEGDGKSADQVHDDLSD